ncbi:MAG: glucose-1-phosphate cytidylyltransferase [Lachnospiraceae bacterium]|jgi:glucose-1-phosphate cytidylyltransferase|nr:glucose-1-phosphate cytidylyltransferase [Lachnospiraceae bacterium]
MKTIILAGGLGTRISEESHLKPKPMIEIGEKPMLWHIMKTYSYHGFHDFIICCGYKAHDIKKYFADYYLHNSDVTFDFRNGNTLETHSNTAEPWRVTLVDTGLKTMTGGRLKRVEAYVGNERFMLTYGDGVSDVDITKLVAFHESHGRLATITSVRPEGRFGMMDLDGHRIDAFREKSQADTGWVNAGFMVFEPQVFAYLDNDETVLERGPLERLAAEGQLMAYKHEGFWQCMDTQRDKQLLDELWNEGHAPWRKW